MGNSAISIIATVIISVGLVSGCSSTNTKSPQVPAEPAPVAREKRDIIVEQRESLAETLLREAQQAFREGRLIEPEHDNAYDKFHSVLILDKGNAQARSGLQAILIRYADLIRDAISTKRYARANELINQSQLYFPANGLLMDLQASLNKLKRFESRQSVVRDSTLPKPNEEIVLPGPALKARSNDVVGLLSQIAERVKGTDESVMIYARTDAEGRWIYQQMKNAIQGYRIRGDIRISSKPRIELLPPL